MKKIHLPSQFPNIYRTITESRVFKKFPKIKISPSNHAKLKKIWFYSKIATTLIVVVVLISGIAIFSFKAYQYYEKVQKVTIQRQQMQSKINFWQSIADKYEGYKDAYFQMAVLDYQLGNISKAKAENKKALILDPNFTDAIKLEEILNK